MAGLVLAAAGTAAHAANPTQCASIVFTPGANAPSLGKIVRGTTATTFVLPNGGPPASTTSGDAILLHPGAVSGDPLQLEVKSGSDNGCKNTGVKFQLSGTHAAGPQIDAVSFTVSIVSGAANLSTTTVPNNGIFQFDFTGNGGNGDAIFKIGMTVTLQSGATGTATWVTSATVQ